MNVAHYHKQYYNHITQYHHSLKPLDELIDRECKQNCRKKAKKAQGKKQREREKTNLATLFLRKRMTLSKRQGREGGTPECA